MSYTHHIGVLIPFSVVSLFFFFNDTATTEIYTLSLHDALPIFEAERNQWDDGNNVVALSPGVVVAYEDRKSTRLNSSHSQISYAVFCLKKKNERDPAYHCRRSVGAVIFLCVASTCACSRTVATS